MITSSSRNLFLSSVAAIILLPGTTLAADLPWIPESPQPQAPLSSSFSIEVFTGYLTGTIEQSAYNCCGEKFAHTKWKIDNAGIVGATLAYRWDWLDLRLSGWTVGWSGNSSDSFTDAIICDLGCRTRVKWRNDEAKLPAMYQIDASIGIRIYQDASFVLTGLAGYRHLRVGLKDRGGHALPNDVLGDLSDLPLSSAYDQWWHTPYVGIGAQHDGAGYSLMAEVIGSPIVFANDRARMIGIEADQSFIYYSNYVSEADYNTWMIGATVGGEVRLTEAFALTGKAQYQYYEAKKDKATVKGACCGMIPASQSGDLSAFTLTVGLKASF